MLLYRTPQLHKIKLYEIYIRFNNALKLLKFTTKMVKILLKQFVNLNEAHFHLGGYVNKQNCRIWGLIFWKMKLERLFR